MELSTFASSSKRVSEAKGGAYLLDIVIAQSASIFELFAGEDKTLLVRWNAFLVLDLGFDVVDRVAGFDLEGDGFAGEGLDEAVCGGLYESRC